MLRIEVSHTVQIVGIGIQIPLVLVGLLFQFLFLVSRQQ